MRPTLPSAGAPCPSRDDGSRAGLAASPLVALRALLAERFAVGGLPASAQDIPSRPARSRRSGSSRAVLIDPGDVVLVENPSYLAALQSFAFAGARIVPVPCDCEQYRRRRDALHDGLAGALPEGSTFNRPDGGMFIWARLPAGWDASELLQSALRHDVAFVPGAPFFAAAPDPRTLRLSFTTHAPEAIVDGLGRLRRAVQT